MLPLQEREVVLKGHPLVSSVPTRAWAFEVEVPANSWVGLLSLCVENPEGPRLRPSLHFLQPVGSLFCKVSCGTGCSHVHLSYRLLHVLQTAPRPFGRSWTVRKQGAPQCDEPLTCCQVLLPLDRKPLSSADPSPCFGDSSHQQSSLSVCQDSL